MIRIGIGLSVVILAGFAAMVAVDPRGAPAVAAVAEDGAGTGSAAPSLPSWHPPLRPEAHPPIDGGALTCPGAGMLPGRAPEGDEKRPAAAPEILSI